MGIIYNNNRITIHLVETVFRNRVVDYINSNLYRFRSENRATFSSAILAEVIVLGLDNLSEEQLIENYLNNMRLIGTWAGSIEIEAITNMLNTNIMRNNELFYSENQIKMKLIIYILY
ncbi:hypothetical protein [Spiroplasma phoeniceum]|uniref:hypothetical protein n=1 Tax=Spiroplasma phoeniceum TaxID=47835 RepID=UPI003364B7C4